MQEFRDSQHSLNHAGLSFTNPGLSPGSELAIFPPPGVSVSFDPLPSGLSPGTVHISKKPSAYRNLPADSLSDTDWFGKSHYLSRLFFTFYVDISKKRKEGEKENSPVDQLLERRPDLDHPCLYANSAIFLLLSTTCAKSSLLRATWTLSPGLLWRSTTSNSNNS